MRAGVVRGYVADIGDNGGKRDRITIYRTPEPDVKDPAHEAGGGVRRAISGWET